VAATSYEKTVDFGLLYDIQLKRKANLSLYRPEEALVAAGDSKNF
jgi:hypothetical protein